MSSVSPSKSEEFNNLMVSVGAELVSNRLQVEALTVLVKALAEKVGMPAMVPAVSCSHKLPDPLPPLNAGEGALAKAGSKIEAIKAYRGRINQCLGLLPSLKESKGLVDSTALGLTILGGTQTTKVLFNSVNPPSLLPAHESMVKAGQPLQAIKAYRDYTGEVCLAKCSLKEAHAVVSYYKASLPVGYASVG